MHSYGYIPDIKDIRDFKFAVQDPMALPLQVDLRTSQQLPAPYDQGNLGSCTANALAFLMEFNRKREHLFDYTPSRLFIYYQERVIENSINSDSGAMLRDGIKALSTYGAPSEADWPYVIPRFSHKPSAKAYKDAIQDLAISYYRINDGDVNGMRACLAAGNPFVFGIPVYESFEASTDGNIPMPRQGEQMLGGHAIAAVGYNDQLQRFIFRNSWGPQWGQRGYGTLPYLYLAQLAQDNWVITATKAAR